MTDHTPPQEITEQAAMLIERAVRGELSPEDLARLEEMASDDPVVSEHLARAQREEHAMSTAAELFTRHADTDRMQQAIRQKLDFDRFMLRRITISFAIWIPVYLLIVAVWPIDLHLMAVSIVVPFLPLAIWGVLTLRRRARLRHALEAGDTTIADEYTRHLTRSRNEHTIARAGWIIVSIALVVGIISDYASSNYARAIIMGVCLATLFFCGWRTVLNRRAQRRTELFFQGRLTLEQLVDRRHDISEQDDG